MIAKNKKKIFLILIVFAAAGLMAKWLLFKPAFRYAGTLEATKVDVPARLTSVIASLNVKEGDKVQAGQTLLQLSGEDYVLNAKLAQDNYNRAQRLFQEGSMSRQDYDALKNKKDDADLKLSWCTIHSPLTGVVLAKYHEPGEMVAPGTKLFTLANLKDIYAYIYVPQPKIAELRLQQTVFGQLPEMQGRRFEGTILWISDEAEFTPKNVQTESERTRLIYAVKVAFKNDDEILKPGMSIEVELAKNEP